MAKCKYYKQARQVFNYLTGQWENTGEYRAGPLIEQDSPDCDKKPTRWVDTDEYICLDCETMQPTVNYLYQLHLFNNKTIGEECGSSPEGIIRHPRPTNIPTLSGYTSNDIESITIGDCCTVIGDSAFDYLSMKNIKQVPLVIPESVKVIGDMAFMGNDATERNRFTGSLNIPDSVIYIGQFAFAHTTFTSLKLSNNLAEIQNDCFRNCSSMKGDLTIPDSVIYIGCTAFYSCQGFDGKLTLSKNLKTIGNYAFYSTNNLKGDVILHESIEVIGNGAFYLCGCSSYTVMAKTPPALTKDVCLTSISSTADQYFPSYDSLIYVPDDALAAYKSAPIWSKYRNIKPLSEKQ